MPEYAVNCAVLDVDILNILSIFKTVIDILKIIVVVALIIWVMMDIVKLVASAEVDTKKVFSIISKRLLAMVLVFFVPLIVDFSLKLVKTEQKYASYYNCADNEIVEEIYILQATEIMAEFISNPHPNHNDYIAARKAVEKIREDNEFSDKEKFTAILDEYQIAMNEGKIPDIFEGLTSSNNPGTPTDITQNNGKLSSAEISKVLNGLPSNISRDRRKIIEIALNAVGNIPYYWGGYATNPGYGGNNFNSPVRPDNKGRTKKGLDCSHFVDWVYWTAVGNNLGNGTTATLLGKSKSVSSQDLIPGDLLFDNAGLTSNNHVGIYVGRNGQGQPLVIYETGGLSSNVVMNTLYPWAVYRRLNPISGVDL